MSSYKLQKSYKYLIPSSPSSKTIRIYADGVYDGFHFGHARQLQQAKLSNQKVYLIAGVSNESETLKFKGKTLMDEAERTLTVQNCCWVDEVLCPCPWLITTEFLESQRIDYVAHDALPYSSVNSGDIYSKVKELGKFFETHRTEGISTSDLIMNIICNRNNWKQYLSQTRTIKRSRVNIGVLESVWVECKRGVKAFGCLKRKKNQEDCKDE